MSLNRRQYERAFPVALRVRSLGLFECFSLGMIEAADPEHVEPPEPKPVPEAAWKGLLASEPLVFVDALPPRSTEADTFVNGTEGVPYAPELDTAARVALCFERSGYWMTDGPPVVPESIP